MNTPREEEEMTDEQAIKQKYPLVERLDEPFWRGIYAAGRGSSWIGHSWADAAAKIRAEQAAIPEAVVAPRWAFDPATLKIACAVE